MSRKLHALTNVAEILNTILSLRTSPSPGVKGYVSHHEWTEIKDTFEDRVHRHVVRRRLVVRLLHKSQHVPHKCLDVVVPGAHHVPNLSIPSGLAITLQLGSAMDINAPTLPISVRWS